MAVKQYLKNNETDEIVYPYTVAESVYVDNDTLANVLANIGIGTPITGTLEAGETSLTLEDESIVDGIMVDVFTDKFGVNPTNVVVSEGSIELTFEEMSEDLNVKVIIR